MQCPQKCILHVDAKMTSLVAICFKSKEYTFRCTHFTLLTLRCENFLFSTFWFLFHSSILILLHVNQLHLFFNKIFKIKRLTFCPERADQYIWLPANTFIPHHHSHLSSVATVWLIGSISAKYCLYPPQEEMTGQMSGQLCLWPLGEGVPAHISSSSW